MIAELKPYPSYKSSAVEWLGDVPAHWDVCRLKRICRLEYGDSLPNDSRVPGEIAVYGSNGVVGQHDKANTIAPCIVVGRKGSFGRVNYCYKPAFAIDTTFFVDGRFSSADMRWLQYLLGWLRLDAVTKDSVVPGLDREDAYQRFAPLPVQAEQTAIARFLDHATNRIDRYIRAKEKLIALLEEQKQALAHNAVTGRIDVRTGKPYPSYTLSGIACLGNVPAHWDVRPAKWHFREVDERSDSGSEELLSVSHLTGVTPRSDKSVTMFKAESNVGHKICRPGDVVINTMWAWMAALGVARQVGIVSPSYAVYRRSDNSLLAVDYGEKLLRSAPYQAEYRRFSTGIRPSRLRLYPDVFLRLRLVCPPLEEQFAIIEFIRRESVNIDRASCVMRKEIATLQEYRTRLIADVVTGKLDVRGATYTKP